jgi:tetratricopeptide (TPR) repeat protein
VEDLQRENTLLDLMFLAEAYIKEGKLDKALETVNEALKIDSRDGRAVLTKARILKRQAMEAEGGEPAKVDKPEAKKLMLKALDCINQAIVLLPGYGEPIYNKACYQALLGFDKTEVLGTLKNAFQLNPGLRKIANEDGDLASLKQDVDFNSLVKMDEPTQA